MKRTQLLVVSALLGGFVLSSCSPSDTRVNNNYNIVTFDYNNGSSNTSYKNVVVMQGQTLEMPEDPNVKDFVFEGWYKEATCENEYKRWGLEIDSSFTLYAKWSKYEDASVDTKTSKFNSVLEKLSTNVYKATQECQAKIMYPAIYEDAFYVNDKYVYNRYSNITIKDYYQVQEDESETYYGQEQFSYDSRYFYQIYHDFEDSKNNTSKQASFDESKIDNVLGIGYYNFFGSGASNLAYYANKEQTDTFSFMYEFTGNYTELADIKNGNYAYKLQYLTATYSDSVGTYVLEQYGYDCGLVIANGKITSASVTTEYFYALGEDDVQYYVLEESIYDFYSASGAYAEYTGTRF